MNGDDRDRTESDEMEEERSTPMAESAGGASEEDAPLVIDEIHDEPTGVDAGPDEEYLVFKNTGDEPLTLAGWTVESEGGQSYRFPDGFTLGVGERVTLHSGHGTDSDTDLYWGADESIWAATGDTVAVETPAGERVVSEPYKS